MIIGEGLRFGILCNSVELQHWQAEIVRMLRDNGHQLCLIITKPSHDEGKPAGNKLKDYPWKNLFYSAYMRLFFKSVMRKPVDMNTELMDIPVQKCRIRRVDFSEFFSDEDVKFIQDQQLDFILRFGFNIIRGKILQSAKFGIWSFHHGDELKYRGGPPCFWEIFYNDPITGAVLQKLNEKLDAGTILRKGWFGTIRHSYSENLDRVYAATIPWVLQVCNDILKGNTTIFEAPGSATQAPLYKAPGNGSMLLFLLRLIWNRIELHLKNLLLHEKWNVGIIEAPPAKVAFNWQVYAKRISWLPEKPRHVYAADPFVYSIGGIHRIVYEEYDYKKLCGNISQQPLLDDDPLQEPTPLLNNGSHFSFPFLIEHEAEIYCLPENAISGKTNLYRLDCSEKSLEFVCELLPFPLVDPVLIQSGDTWWLFGTKPGYASECLYLYYADNFCGPYTAHVNNPVKTDISSSRPAGKPFLSDGVLYRPAQNCSLKYGGSIAINQVLTLTKDEFLEQTVTEIFPSTKWAYKSGIHTIAGNQRYTVVDAKKLRFIPEATWARFKARIRLSK